MSWPQPFGAGQTVEPGAVVTARWLTADGRLHATKRTQPLRWGQPVPPPMEPPRDDDHVRWDESDGTGFAPG